MARRFEGKTCVVTGGAAGIGAAIARRLAAEGGRVVVADIDAEGGAAVAAEIGGLFVECDTSDEEQVQALMARAGEWAAEGGGGVRVLVNNAAAFVFGRVGDVSAEQWERALGVNVRGYAFCMKHALPLLEAAGGGAVVNLGSISSFVAQPAFTPYNTTKGAIVQLSRCVALDYAAAGVRVNTVCPGPIETQATLRHAESQGKTREDLVAEMAGALMIKRMGTPEEVAAAAAFLASDEASFITGTNLMVDGGYVSL